MKKILCPTDFSEAAINGIAYAAKLAQSGNYEVTLLNVQSKFDITPHDLLQGRGERLNLVAHELEEQSKEVAKAFHIPCYAEIEQTLLPLSTVISEKADDYDLIVMGSNGADDLLQLFTGSNTYNTVLHTSTPLLIIPCNYVYSKPQKVVYAFNYLENATLPISPLISFLRPLESELTILQVMEEAISKDAEEDLYDVQRTIRRVLTSDVAFNFETIYANHAAEGINDFVVSHEADMLALCIVHRNMVERLFHKSVLKKISAISKVPVYVFHE
jgi:nucleotide-binding universal stress UspA family protein